MRPDPDSQSLTPDRRRQAVAAVLAVGLVRLAERPPPSPALDPKNLEDSGPDCLELPGDLRLSVHTGLRTAPPRETEDRTCN
jgi:hypothetical protein